jgi:hypothetical protein
MKDADRWLSTPIVAGAFEFRYGVRGPAIFYEYLVADKRYEFFTGEAPDWKWVEDDRTLYVTNPRRRIDLNVLFVRNRTPDEIPWHLEFDYEEVALANAKILLARILGSYGSIPGATGEIPTDAANLREEGMATIERVRLRLERSAASYITPRYIG